MLQSDTTRRGSAWARTWLGTNCFRLLISGSWEIWLLRNFQSCLLWDAQWGKMMEILGRKIWIWNGIWKKVNVSFHGGQKEQVLVVQVENAAFLNVLCSRKWGSNESPIVDRQRHDKDDIINLFTITTSIWKFYF